MKNNEQIIRGLFSLFRLDQKALCEEAMASLKAYRKVCEEVDHRQKEKKEILGVDSDQNLDAAVVAWESFSREKEKAEFNRELGGYYESHKLVKSIDKAIEGVKHYPKMGERYYVILSSRYINLIEKDDEQIADELGISRSQYFQQRKEATLLFAFVLGIKEKTKQK